MKLMHISDLHFGKQAAQILSYFLEDLNLLKPDVVIVSGDLTQRATTDQFETCVNFLKRIPAVVVVAPGNHDIPLYNIFLRWISPFGRYNRYIRAQFSSTFKNDSVRILGVNSVNPYRVKDGKLSRATLSAIKTYFADPFEGLNLLFLHHNFDYMQGLHKPLENYEHFLNELKESPIDVVCTGHSHFASISLIEKTNHDACVLMHAGTLLCDRSKDYLNSYYFLETTAKGCQIQWRVFQDHAFTTLTVHDIDFSKPYPYAESVERGS